MKTHIHICIMKVRTKGALSRDCDSGDALLWVSPSLKTLLVEPNPETIVDLD